MTALTNKIKRKVNLLEVFPSHMCYMVCRVLQRNRSNKMYKYIERKIYCQELADMIVGLGKSEICRAGQQPGEPGKKCMLQTGVQRQFGCRIPSFLGDLIFLS